jgi:hypothetical protein
MALRSRAIARPANGARRSGLLIAAGLDIGPATYFPREVARTTDRSADHTEFGTNPADLVSVHSYFAGTGNRPLWVLLVFPSLPCLSPGALLPSPTSVYRSVNGCGDSARAWSSALAYIYVTTSLLARTLFASSHLIKWKNSVGSHRFSSFI